MIRLINAVAVDCDHRDGDDTCTTALLLRAADTSAIVRAEVLVTAAARGWAVEDGHLCPKHRPTTTAAPTAETGA